MKGWYDARKHHSRQLCLSAQLWIRRRGNPTASPAMVAHCVSKYRLIASGCAAQVNRMVNWLLSADIRNAHEADAAAAAIAGLLHLNAIG